MTAFNGLSKRGRITRGHVLNKHLCHWFLHQVKPVSLIGHMNKSFWVGLVSPDVRVVAHILIHKGRRRNTHAEI